MAVNNPSTIPISTRLVFALLAATPFCLLQLVFLADCYSWAVFLFGYMGIVMAAPAVFAGLGVFALAEVRLRRYASVRTAPHFAIAGGLLLPTFFVPAIIAKPILIEFPQYCRVTQSIKWETTKPNPDWKTNHSFILVVIGTGTPSKHQFSSGYLNWTGKEPAGISSIRFNPLSFDATELVERITASGLAADEIAALSEEIWATCTQIESEGHITSKSGVIDSIDCHLVDQWDYIIGGWVWMILLCLFFLLIGYKTIKTELRDQQVV